MTEKEKFIETCRELGVPYEAILEIHMAKAKTVGEYYRCSVFKRKKSNLQYILKYFPHENLWIAWKKEKIEKYTFKKDKVSDIALDRLQFFTKGIEFSNRKRTQIYAFPPEITKDFLNKIVKAKQINTKNK